jgi:hypothetical protein
MGATTPACAYGTVPSMKSIDVVRHRDRDLHVCLECSSDLVQPVDWQEAGPDHWNVRLRCPNCEVHRKGMFTQQAVEAFDKELDRGAEALKRDHKQVTQTNMVDEIARFVAALNADAILPEDF